jgi:glycosyltransferase involved in cell wall biosynthesis
MKKIAFIMESLQCGGAEKSLVTLLQNMNFDEYQIDLILMAEDGDFKKFVPEQVDIKIVDVFSNIEGFKLKQLRLEYALRRKINIKKLEHNAQLHWKTFGKSIQKIDEFYDIAIAYNQGFATYFVAEKIAATRKIAWLNTDYQKAGYNIKFDIDKYKTFDTIVAVSNECEESFKYELNKFGIQLQTTVIKDITDIAIVNKLSQEYIGFTNDKSSIKICSVGRLAQPKGWYLAIEALYILKQRNRDIKWYIIGEGPKRSELELLIKTKQLENNLILLGYKENPYPYMKTCDIYVQTSLFEGLGLTVIEAAILQKPIVTTNFPTASTIVENNQTGLICEMDAVAIANAIEIYLDDKAFVLKVKQNLSNLENRDKEISLNKINSLLNQELS